MKSKNIISAALVVFVVVSVAYIVIKESRQRREATPDNAALEAPALDSEKGEADKRSDRVIAYYFHNFKRCPTCQKFEDYTNEAIETNFSEELKSGRLEWLVVNVDVYKNEHFVQDYELSTKAVVLVDIKGGHQVRWKKLGEIWDRVSDKATFIAYIRKEIKAFLEGE